MNPPPWGENTSKGWWGNNCPLKNRLFFPQGKRGKKKAGENKEKNREELGRPPQQLVKAEKISKSF